MFSVIGNIMAASFHTEVCCSLPCYKVGVHCSLPLCQVGMCNPPLRCQVGTGNLPLWCVWLSTMLAVWDVLLAAWTGWSTWFAAKLWNVAHWPAAGLEWVTLCHPLQAWLSAVSPRRGSPYAMQPGWGGSLTRMRCDALYGTTVLQNWGVRCCLLLLARLESMVFLHIQIVPVQWQVILQLQLDDNEFLPIIP